jgi:hypothetical protein
MATDTQITELVERQLAEMAHDYRAYFGWDAARVDDAIATARPKLIEKARESRAICVRYRIGSAPINEHSTMTYQLQGISRS